MGIERRNAQDSICGVGATARECRHGAAIASSLRTPLRMSAPEQVGANVKLTFTQEMRAKAMSLHTFSQAPKEGKARDTSANTVVDQWETTKEDFLQFLVDSLVVYQAFGETLPLSRASMSSLYPCRRRRRPSTPPSSRSSQRRPLSATSTITTLRILPGGV